MNCAYSALVGLVALSLSCSPKATAPTVALQPPARRQIDWPVAWTPDGGGFLFRRLVASKYGPPGLYLLGFGDSEPRYVMPATLLWPKTASFSPDRLRFVVSFGLELQIVDLETNTVTMPFYTPHGADYPAWLKDGRRIVYSRVSSFFQDPPESAGTHVFDLETKLDIPILYQGSPLGGFGTSVSPATGQIAFAHFGPQRYHVLLADPELSVISEIVPPPLPGAITNTQWEYDSRTGKHQVLFSLDPGGLTPSQRTYAADLLTHNVTLLPEVRPPFDRISPDGSSVLTTGVDPRDSSVVLFIQSIGNPLGQVSRQVTRWSPP